MNRFGFLSDGTEIHSICLDNGTVRCEVLTYGALVRSITVADRNGVPTDVALGFDSVEDYVAQDKFIGAVVGRYANRIGGCSFDLNGVNYPLFDNDGGNHLHGGKLGYDRRVWNVVSYDAQHATLSCTSPDGEEGYPGTLEITVTYRLLSDGLQLSYRATTDRDTICNLTNHCYFNLSGHGAGSIEDHSIVINADRYTPTDSGSIPTGELAEVAGTPLDLREETRIGAHIDDDFEQLRMAGGYDHNFVLNGDPGTLRLAATAVSPVSGIAMSVYTDQPGVQFYTGNYLAGCPAGKGGAAYEKRCGFCLETQLFPDTPHHDHFPTCVLRPGEEYVHEMQLRFSVR